MIENNEDLMRAFEGRGNAPQADNTTPLRLGAEEADSPTESILKNFYYREPGRYLVHTKQGWRPINEKFIKQRLIAAGVDNEEAAMMQIEDENYIPSDNVFKSWPGRNADVYPKEGGRLIVLNDYYYPHPTGKHGNWDTIQKVLMARFGAEQFPYFISWIRGARQRIQESLAGGNTTSHVQILFLIVGEGVGKTSIILKHLIAPLIGGEVVNYSGYLKSETGFNGELLDGCLLVADDMDGLKNRTQAAKKQKEIGYSGAVSIERKGKDRITVNAPWCQVVVANDNEEGLKGVPDFESANSTDKLIALHVGKYGEMPPNSTAQERKELDEAIESELDAFAYFVDHYAAPENIKDENGRHPCKAYIAPVLREKLFGLTDSGRLADAIETYQRQDDAHSVERLCPADGLLAGEIRSLLQDCYACRDKIKDISNSKSMGLRLTKLEKVRPDIVQVYKGHSRKTFYKISPVSEWRDEVQESA